MLYKLLIYLKQHDQLHLVDCYYNEDLEALTHLGTERCANNVDYTAFLVTYKSVAAEVLFEAGSKPSVDASI